MRRREREITDRAAIDGIIARCSVCRLALCENGQPYVLPLNFGYDGIYLYFHSAPAGRKIDIIRANNRVAFEFDILHEVVTAKNPCEWGARYESVVGTGTAEFIESPREKASALAFILKQYGGSFGEFEDKAVSSVAVFRVAVVSISGKEKR